MTRKRLSLGLAVAVLAVLLMGVVIAAAPSGIDVSEWVYTKRVGVFAESDMYPAVLVDTSGTNTLLDMGVSGTSKFKVANGGGLTTTVGQEHVGLPTIDSAAIITSTSGTLWTVGASEIWFVHNVYCEITTNFDCTGNDCTFIIGDGNDTDGFLVLTDAEMQAADAEYTGAPAGWKGLHTDSQGAYLSGLGGFVYDGTDTIDGVVGGTDPAAGNATCYIVYTRYQ